MTDKEVKELIDEYMVPLHVQRHCGAVAAFAVGLAEKLISKGEKIDINLVRQAAMLHDFVRIVDFRTFTPEKFPDHATPAQIEFWKNLREKYKGMHHADAAADILEALGHRKIAEVIRKHKFLQIEKGFDTWEERIVYYADKRVKHHTVVPLKERLEDGRKRNFSDMQGSVNSQELDKKIYALEKHIMAPLGGIIL